MLYVVIKWFDLLWEIMDLMFFEVRKFVYFGISMMFWCSILFDVNVCRLEGIFEVIYCDLYKIYCNEFLLDS